MALPSRRLIRRFLSAGLVAASFAAPATASAFDLGFNDYDLTRYADGTATNETAFATGLAHARAAGATTWRFGVYWYDIAPAAAPSETAAADPAMPGYRWEATDRIVRAVAQGGLQPVVWLAGAPTWAEGAKRPPESRMTPTGTWKPDARAFGVFAGAFARRYSGTFPDPQRPGSALPRIATFQGWNEPNLYTNLTPQWERVGGRWSLTAPATFRRLQNALYEGIKKVQPTATVLTGGTGPFGDLEPGDPRSAPALFWRTLLCVKPGKSLRGTSSCPKTRFDGWAHHTYPIGPPSRTARNADDVVVPDMGKLTRIMAAAQRAGTIRSGAAKNIWMTEMSWDTAPDPDGVSLEDQANYMQGAFYVLWKAGVKHVVWWNSRDDAKGADWGATLQSGIYFRGADPSQDQPKPSYTAYRFPFAAYRLRGVARLWTKAASPGPVTIQVQKGGAWVDVAKLAASSDGVATGRLRVGVGIKLRAVQGDAISLPWTTF